MKITKEELLKIAELSSLKLLNSEIVLFVDQIKTILDYADQLQNVPISKEVESITNINIFREDVIEENKSKSKEILNLAPKEENGYFVVPKILE